MFFFEKNNNLPDRHPQAVYNDSDIILGLSYGIYSGTGFLEDLNFVRSQVYIIVLCQR